MLTFPVAHFKRAAAEGFDLSAGITFEKSEVVGSAPHDVAWNDTGSKFYILRDNQTVEQYSASPNFDIGSPTLDGSFDFSSITSGSNTPRGMHWSNTGDKLFIIFQSGTPNPNVIYQLDIPNVFDVTTGSITADGFRTVQNDGNPQGLHFSNDGLTVFWIGSSTDIVRQLALNSAFDILTGTSEPIAEEKNAGNSFGISSATEVFVSPDGTKMFVAANSDADGNDNVHQFNLSTPDEVDTHGGDSDAIVNVAAQDAQIRGLTFNDDGTKMYITGTSNDSVYQYAVN